MLLVIMKTNKLIIAAAGSGKTALLINEALKIKDQTVLIATYTDANKSEIIRKIYDINKFIPPNIIIKTWYSFLLKEGVRPYQGYMFQNDINGIHLTNEISAKNFRQNDIRNHYFDDLCRIYTDKISKFILECNTLSDGKVIKRIECAYPNIFIDEVQDLAGYDLEFLLQLLKSRINTLLVCDPRQWTYSTNNSQKNKQYQGSKIINFFEKHKKIIDIDNSTFNKSYRSILKICNFSSRLYPEYSEITSGNDESTSHDGIYLVRKQDVENYISKYNPFQLRYSSKTKVDGRYGVMTFGTSKGLTFERILIYPTKDMEKWLRDTNQNLTDATRAKLYVAITRAKYSVAFVYNYKNGETIKDLINYESTE